MQVLLSAPALAGFNLDSVRRYAEERFTALRKYLPDLSKDVQIRVSVRKERAFYKVSVEVRLDQTVFIQTEHINLFAAIDELSKLLKRSANRQRTKSRKR